MKSGLLVCIVGLSIGLTGCNRTPDDAENSSGMNDTAGAVGTTGTTDSVRVADIVDAPDKYFGKTVTVVADVEEVLGPRAFALDEDAPLAGGIDRDLLVFSKKAGNLSDIDDQWLNNKVRVSGTVGRLSVVEIEREVGWDLDPQIEAELERASAVIIASSVDRVQQDGGAVGARQDRDMAQRGGESDRAQRDRADLPGTASAVPLAGLIGLLSLGGAIGARVYNNSRRR